MFHPVGLRLYYYWTASTSTGPNGRQLWWCCPCSGLSTHIVAHNRNCEQGYGVLFTRPSLARYWVIMQHETRSLALRALAATRPRVRNVRYSGWRSISVQHRWESMSSPRTRVKGSKRKNVFDIMNAVGRTIPGWWLEWSNRAPRNRVQHSKYHLKW